MSETETIPATITRMNESLVEEIKLLESLLVPESIVDLHVEPTYSMYKGYNKQLTIMIRKYRKTIVSNDELREFVRVQNINLNNSLK